MEARLVWDTWRRILTSDVLADSVVNGQAGGPGTDGFSAEEAAIIADYASTPLQTETNIGMFRIGLGRNSLAALALAPMSRNIFLQQFEDSDPVVDEFVRSTGFVDYGPNFWRLAGDLVAFLASQPALSAQPLREVFALDGALCALAQSLARNSPSIWPEDCTADWVDKHDVAAADSNWAASPAAAVVPSTYDLTSWIVDPTGFDSNEVLQASTRHWLIYFPNENAAPAYAELSERSARVFAALATPMSCIAAAEVLVDLTAAEVAEAMKSLAELGIILPDQPDVAALAETDFEQVLPDDAFVVLDPAVMVLDAELDGYRFMVHEQIDVGMTIPPGDGLLDFVNNLSGKPISVGVLRRAYDDGELVDKMLANLRVHGFAHKVSGELPGSAELAELRARAETARAEWLRTAIEFDLDAQGEIEPICAALGAGPAAPQLTLRCRCIADHRSLIAELARRRQSGLLRIHRTTLHAKNLEVCEATCEALLSLGACVVLDGGLWPSPPQPYPGLAALIRHRVEVQVAVTPDGSLLDPNVRADVVAWATSTFVTGLQLTLDPGLIWGGREASDSDIAALLTVLTALEDALGDVQLSNLPGDAVLLAQTGHACDFRGDASVLDRLRLAYVRWRVPILKLIEGENTWSQTTEAEAKVVIPQTDLLPNNPDLLGLFPGAVLVDVCGGLGRVARRMAPALGADGLVISIEMLPCLSDRARQVAALQGISNVSFRTGLAQRLPLADGVADAAVNEWTAGIWELGLGPEMLREMARVVRRNGRVAVTHRLVRMPLAKLDQPWVQFPQIYDLMHKAFDGAALSILEERVWGQVSPSLVGEYAADWRKQYVPRLVSPYDLFYNCEEESGKHADVYLTIVAERQ